ncbi:PepSY domain-containing protein [Xinfangfangia sp. D13-10-4-6]|uniref:PepSY-associated TM helix domain-containing protein n=1 Tax=Pseudogemmobacter hezensis TaxID=2737662 RepID=UPI0015577127|nr:PepSY-associated TM helix domain-containing protein [Pseudogemmobacter hezensis]NPD16988.1 PepSY domain-containing protein [Pseudogemmobacter hezensis]
MKNGFRQSMAWLHTWTGLLLGWLLFAIFLTGTLAYFRSEITYWMKPELHVSQPAGDPVPLALSRLAQLAPAAPSWSITLPDQRNPSLSVSWSNPGEAPGRRGGPSAILDQTSGQILHPRQTAGGDFLYRFHFELYGLPRALARWIVGIATMAMFVAIISGVITHKKIFKEFFTFRPGKGQRSWLDMHNMTAVLALPYHIMITFSGLVLFVSTLMPLVIERGPQRPPQPAAEVAEAPPPRPLPQLTAIAPLMAQAETAWGGMPVGRIQIEKLDTDTPEILLVPQRQSVVTVQSGSGANGSERMRFDALTGRQIEATGVPEASVVAQVNMALGALHRARFSDTGLRWLFFAAGLAGTLMIGTGMVLWVSKRAMKHAKSGVQPFGLRLVDRLNVGGIAGLCLASAGYFWANRLIPAAAENRAGLEIAAFLLIWAAAAIHPFLRGTEKSWSEQLALTAVLALLLPVLNMATGPSGLPQALMAGNMVLASVDLMALICGAVAAIAAWKARPGQQKKPKANRRPPAAKPAPAAAVAQTGVPQTGVPQTGVAGE